MRGTGAQGWGNKQAATQRGGAAAILPATPTNVLLVGAFIQVQSHHNCKPWHQDKEDKEVLMLVPAGVLRFPLGFINPCSCFHPARRHRGLAHSV